MHVRQSVEIAAPIILDRLRGVRRLWNNDELGGHGPRLLFELRHGDHHSGTRSVTFEMRLRLPVDQPDGMAKFGWEIRGDAGPYANAPLEIRASGG